MHNLRRHHIKSSEQQNFDNRKNYLVYLILGAKDIKNIYTSIITNYHLSTKID